MQLVSVSPCDRDPDSVRELYRHLEHGDVLLLNETPFLPAPDDLAFLITQRQSESRTHKNIAYKPDVDRTTGTKAESPETAARLHSILSSYSQGAIAFLTELLPQYATGWKVDYASFRPLEEAGRKLPARRRNDLMHVDAFPSRPTHGGRILRAFTNIHPRRPRVWATAGPFEDLARQFAREAGLERVLSPGARLRRALIRGMHIAGIKGADRSPYDEFMLRFHDWLKTNEEFQRSVWENVFTFAPGSTWISFTDQVAHKVLSGRFALEQTFVVPLSVCAEPETAPIRVLERCAGRPLAQERKTVLPPGTAPEPAQVSLNA